MTRTPLTYLSEESAVLAQSFEQRLAMLDDALPHAEESVRRMLLDVRASVVRLRRELSDIRVTFLSPPMTVAPACFDCGLQHLDVFYTSKHGGYHLCESCFSRRRLHGRARDCGDATEPTVGSIPSPI